MSDRICLIALALTLLINTSNGLFAPSSPNGDKMPGESYEFTSKKYKDNEACTLTIKGSTTNQRIIVSIEKMDIAPDGNCGDSLKIYDGKVGGTLLNSVATEQCGKKDFYVRSNSNTAVIVFSSNNDGKQGTGFTATVAIDFFRIQLVHVDE
ncbi:unnamed protein product, partial [Didymodactylos carnosus]